MARELTKANADWGIRNAEFVERAAVMGWYGEIFQEHQI
jgi:hypothetical protein